MQITGGLAAVSQDSDDPKRARILEGALKVFLAYGFSRTTMDDIARAADLSRPALYLVFRNKTDIYQAIARCVLARCVEQARAVLSGTGSLIERLDLLLGEVMWATLRPIKESPHGAELLDIKGRLAGDIMEEWRAHMETVLEEAFARDARESGADLSSRGLTARLVAETFLDALEGMSQRLRDPNCHPAQAKEVARVVVAALRP